MVIQKHTNWIHIIAWTDRQKVLVEYYAILPFHIIIIEPVRPYTASVMQYCRQLLCLYSPYEPQIVRYALARFLETRQWPFHAK